MLPTSSSSPAEHKGLRVQCCSDPMGLGIPRTSQRDSETYVVPRIKPKLVHDLSLGSLSLGRVPLFQKEYKDIHTHESGHPQSLSPVLTPSAKTLSQIRSHSDILGRLTDQGVLFHQYCGNGGPSEPPK